MIIKKIVLICLSFCMNSLAKNILQELERHSNCISNSTNVTDFAADRPTHSHVTLPDKDCNITHTSETPAIVETTPNENIKLPCKEELLSRHDCCTAHYSMDNETLQHATVQRDSAGRLTYFELRVALQADYFMGIRLKDKDYSNICYIRVGYESNQYTGLYLYKRATTVQRTHTPDILSSTQFRNFYIKVDNGTLQFGKEGDSTPLISHYDDRFRSLNYFWFSYYGHNTSKIRYDCPHVPESS